jgi:hypothetical protein
MDINKIINDIKNSKIFQYTIMTSVAGIIVYSGFSLFFGNESGPKNDINTNVIPSKENVELKNKNEMSMNQKRILQEMKIDYKKAKNPNDVYLSNSSSISNNDIKIGNNIEVENKIYQGNFQANMTNNSDKNNNSADKNKINLTILKYNQT